MTLLFSFEGDTPMDITLNKHLNLILILALFLIIIPFLSYGQNDKATEKLILKKLFHVEIICLAKDEKKNIEIVSTRLRGRWASIPLNHSFLQQFDSNMAALAFEIYLSDNPLDYKNFIDTLNNYLGLEKFEYIAKINPQKVKLIQLVYFDLANNKFITKPDGFPLEQSFWMADTYGDMGSRDIQIKSFEKIPDSPLNTETFKNKIPE